MNLYEAPVHDYRPLLSVMGLHSDNDRSWTGLL